MLLWEEVWSMQCLASGELWEAPLHCADTLRLMGGHPGGVGGFHGHEAWGMLGAHQDCPDVTEARTGPQGH